MLLLMLLLEILLHYLALVNLNLYLETISKAV